jgi:hypothetical protein
MHSIREIFESAQNIFSNASPEDWNSRQVVLLGTSLDLACSLNVVDGLLSYAEHVRVVEFLSSASLNWVLQSALPNRAASGVAYQLASSAEHDKQDMREVAELIASAAYQVVSKYPEIAASDQIVPQVFPVVMYGNSDDPPYQVPHQDSHDGSSGSVFPLLTMVYYVVVNNTCGGSLVGLKVTKQGKIVQCFRHQPAMNQLVVMRGSQTHLVEPLWRGTRISLVINFYRDLS